MSRPDAEPGQRPGLTLPAPLPAVDSPPRSMPPESIAVDRLRRLVERQSELRGEVEDEVRSLLKHGHSWSLIGHALGLSRQGARQRYRHLVVDSANSPVCTSRHTGGIVTATGRLDQVPRH